MQNPQDHNRPRPLAIRNRAIKSPMLQPPPGAYENSPGMFPSSGAAGMRNKRQITKRKPSRAVLTERRQVEIQFFAENIRAASEIQILAEKLICFYNSQNQREAVLMLALYSQDRKCKTYIVVILSFRILLFCPFVRSLLSR